jgi:DNA-binding response OmpR family regulator
MLERSGFSARVTTSVHDGAPAADVVVLGPSGGIAARATACRKLREEGYVGAILAACADVTEGDRLLDAGADDFVTAPFNELELASRVRSCERRTAARPHLHWGPLQLDRVRRTLHLRGKEIAVTPRDIELLACLMEAGGRAVSRARLRERVWPGKEDRGTNVVEVHLSRLRDKLGDDAWMIETVRRAGYRLRRGGHASR